MEAEEGKTGIPEKKKTKRECNILCHELTDI